MSGYLIDMMLSLFAGLNVAVYADNGHAANLGVGVACGVAALIQRPSQQ